MTALAPMGHNMPPSDEQILTEKLRTNYAAEVQAIEELGKREIAPIVDEETSEKAAEFLNDVKKAKKAIDAAHKAEKGIFNRLGDIVDGFKRGHTAKLDKIAGPASEQQEQYLLKKAAVERARLREIAEKKRQDAEDLAAQAEVHAEAEIHDTAQALMDKSISSDESALRIGNYASTAKASKLAKTVSESGATSGLRTAWAGEPEHGNYGGVDLLALRQYLKDEDIQKAINAFVKDGGRELGGVKIYQKSTLR